MLKSVKAGVAAFAVAGGALALFGGQAVSTAFSSDASGSIAATGATVSLATTNFGDNMQLQGLLPGNTASAPAFTITNNSTTPATPLAPPARPASRSIGYTMRARLTAVGLAIGVALAGLFAYVSFFTTHAYITTPSMYPTIPPGSMVFIQKESSYHVGEVIDFHGNGLDYTHRIIHIAPNGDITTKGDNPQNSPDLFNPPTTKADVIGKGWRGCAPSSDCRED